MIETISTLVTVGTDNLVLEHFKGRKTILWSVRSFLRIALSFCFVLYLKGLVPYKLSWYLTHSQSFGSISGSRKR